MRRRHIFAYLALLFAALAAGCRAESAPGAVHVLTADTEVNGVLERYLDRGIDRGERDEAAAVLILIDTPGGRIDSMRTIVGRIRESEVPVITFVFPQGAQAASAGTFIAMAGHLAAMAPITSIGAATPVTGTGGDVEGDLGKKVTEDTVSFAKGVAEPRGPEAVAWAEQAVRQAASATASEAVALGVVDLEAFSIEALLGAVHGREVRLLSGATVTLDVAGSELVFNNRNLYERVLGVISDPVVVSILILIGLGGLAIEFLNPGLFLPAVVGITATIASFLGVGTLLPAEAAAVFILLGIALFVLEAFVPSGGILGSGGAVVIVLGLSILVGQGSTDMDVRGLLTVLGYGALAALLMGTAAFVMFSVRFMSRTDAEAAREQDGGQ